MNWCLFEAEVSHNLLDVPEFSLSYAAIGLDHRILLLPLYSLLSVFVFAFNSICIVFLCFRNWSSHSVFVCASFLSSLTSARGQRKISCKMRADFRWQDEEWFFASRFFFLFFFLTLSVGDWFFYSFYTFYYSVFEKWKRSKEEMN